VSRLENWLDEEPRRTAADYACDIARDAFWRDERSRLISAHPDWPEIAYLLGLGEAVAHALVLVLSRLPVAERLPFAERFFERRLPLHGRAGEADRLTVAAQIALLVLDLTALRDDAIVDLLQGAAQGDDLTATPAPAVVRLQKAIATIRFDPAFEDETDPHAVATIAAIEVLDPSSDEIAVPEIVARAAFAAVECRPREEAVSFLVEAERILALGGAHP
jgi:hypothetical protein